MKKKLRIEFKEKTITYITAGFALVAGLAWNDAIRALIAFIFPESAASSLFAKFFYAFLVTGILVFVTVNLTRLLAERDAEEQK